MSAWEPGQARLREGSILLLAGFPGEDEQVPAGQMLEIEEALLSFTRAALAQGHGIVLPADRVVAPLVAQISSEYAPPRRTEAREVAPALVEVVLTRGRDARLERMLAELPQVGTTVFGGGREAREGARHRLTAEAVMGARPASAVLIGGGNGLLEDFRLLRELDVAVNVIGTTLVRSRDEHHELQEFDVSERLLREVEWRRHGDEGMAREVGRQVPYPYLMQRLLAEEHGENGPTPEKEISL